MAQRNSKAVLLVVSIFALLLLFNFIFFVEPRPASEDEYSANRSSYLATPYGTLAFYTLLGESGYDVARYEKPYTELKENPDLRTLVVIAPPEATNPTQEEFRSLQEWVESGGMVVIIDREIYVAFGDAVARTEPAEMLAHGPVRALQPTPYARGVERVALSQYATRVQLESDAATYHFGDERAAVLADAKVGRGRVVLLTDPYVVANNGIVLADNAMLAINLFVERPAGKIAFDEFHHGYGAASARGGMMSYFRGTPIPWMIAQVALIAAVVVYSLGRRFGRPLPVRRERRTTNLEFVSSMANITRLAQAHDLAMQNVYSEFRKRLCRYNGLPPRTSNARLASMTARRRGVNEAELAEILERCEQIARGAEATDAQLLQLVTRIREIESQIEH